MIPAPYYQDDAVTIFHGDCREIVPHLGRFDLLLTDPPYGINLDTAKSGNRNRQQFAKIFDDDKHFDPSPFMGFPDVFLWGCNHFCDRIPPHEGQWYFWDKVTQNSLNVRIAEGEYAWHKNGTKPRAFRHLWSGAYRASEGGQRSEHPTQKPLELMAWCIGLAGESARTILDPFAGSGTTGRAAKDLGRKATLIEREERYCEIAARRMAQEVLAL